MVESSVEPGPVAACSDRRLLYIVQFVAPGGTGPCRGGDETKVQVASWGARRSGGLGDSPEGLRRTTRGSAAG